jgi:hypothetical protein
MTDTTGLAWELAHLATEHLTSREHTDVYVAIGAGDTHVAIALLLVILVRHRVGIPESVPPRVTSWLDAYAGSDDEDRLRPLIRRLNLRSRDTAREGSEIPELNQGTTQLAVTDRYRSGRRPATTA